LHFSIQFDPEVSKSTAELQVEAHKAKLEKSKREQEEAEDSDDSADEETPSSSSTAAATASSLPSAAVKPLPKSASIAELRERVRQRIADMRAKRGLPPTENGNNKGDDEDSDEDGNETINSAKSRQEILERRLKKKKAKKELMKKRKEQNSKTGKDLAVSGKHANRMRVRTIIDFDNTGHGHPSREQEAGYRIKVKERHRKYLVR
jgi:hypothetical protein